METFPTARHDQLVIEHVGDEVLVYNLVTHEAHCLNAVAGEVWKRCDGRTSPAALAAALADVDVEPALAQLSNAGLLQVPYEPRGSVSRRDLLRKVGLAAALVPLITSIPSPAPAAAISVTASKTTGGTCSSNFQCKSRNCHKLVGQATGTCT